MGQFEVAALKRGETVPDVLAPSQQCDAVVGDGQVTSCPLTLKRGAWDVFVRAVNDAGSSPWLQGASVTVNSCTDADAAAGVCEEFDKGPGGGFVFYDAGSRQPWGQYLEAAPAGWTGGDRDPRVQWCAKGQPGRETSLATGVGIGSGAANTKLIIENCGTNSAAGLAVAYRGGGKSDWFLASKDELSKVYDRRTEIGGMQVFLQYQDFFWSSSQGSRRADEAWVQDMYEGEQGEGYKGSGAPENGSTGYRVRPIRAF